MIHDAIFCDSPAPGHARGQLEAPVERGRSAAAVRSDTDVAEAADLAAANPQIAERLLAGYRTWDAELMNPRWPGRLEGTPAARGAAGN